MVSGSALAFVVASENNDRISNAQDDVPGEHLIQGQAVPRNSVLRQIDKTYAT